MVSVSRSITTLLLVELLIGFLLDDTNDFGTNESSLISSKLAVSRFCSNTSTDVNCCGAFSFSSIISFLLMFGYDVVSLTKSQSVKLNACF